MAGINYNDLLSAFGSGALKLRSQGSAIPQGPSKPGYVQGTANTIPAYRPTGQVLGASTTSRSSSPQPTNFVGNLLSSPQQNLPNFSGPANDQAAAELQSLNTEFDRNAASLQGQLGSLDTQRANALSSLDTEYQGVQKQVGNARTNAQTNTDKNIQDALSTAQDVERANRNKLRALGILNSSAAGDVLSRPLIEYDKQRGNLLSVLGQRNQELDDFMNQKVSEHANAVSQIQAQYADLVGKIQNDLRFNDRQRADAIKSANAALQQRMAEIQQAQFNYAAQVDAQKKQLATQLLSLNSYQNPTADTKAILSQIYNITPQQQNSVGIGIAPEDPRKKLLSGGLRS